ncbi:hypothetical protein DFA_06515 [Cavenderia fasciculata]|uniref:Uncharacterized protein n=1 Tax=Cavenderia fasciculata TaxID=261658 RepID=F4PJ79_CACFS|nr:uncharacterized protein DFA_06515 [Cavenderia fasciculata]EGG24365.1 hypothetical protein DFA_06515 [Cavenderia fasciculata]|eukprot:XP_004362216.1 hypothetical protein DFA_06515 [Cavenderia fasciculata]
MYLSPFIHSIINQLDYPNNSQQQYYNNNHINNNKYDLSQLQTIIIEQIFEYIQDVVDVISLLLTCKKMLLLPFKSQHHHQQYQHQSLTARHIKRVFDKTTDFLNRLSTYHRYCNHLKNIQSQYNFETMRDFFNLSTDHRLVLDMHDPPYEQYKQLQQQKRQQRLGTVKNPSQPTEITHSVLLERLDSNRNIRSIYDVPKTSKSLFLSFQHDKGIAKSILPPDLQELGIRSTNDSFGELPDTLTSLTLLTNQTPLQHELPRSLCTLVAFPHIITCIPASVKSFTIAKEDSSVSTAQKIPRTMFPYDSQLVELLIETEVDLDVGVDEENNNNNNYYFFPINITKMTLHIRQPLLHCFLSPNLKSLTIQTKSKTGFGQGLASLCHLEYFDLVLLHQSCRLEDLHLPSSLRVLKLKSYTRQFLWEGFLPPHLESLTLKLLSTYIVPITKGIFPPSLKTLDLQVNIQSQIDVGALPSSLTSLGLKCEQELVVGVIPHGLVELELREHKHLINQQNVLPDSITRLSLPGYQQFDLSTFAFPPKLKKLELMNLKEKIILKQDTDGSGHSRCLPLTLEKWFSNIGIVGGIPIDHLPNLRAIKYPINPLDENLLSIFSTHSNTTTPTIPKQIKKLYLYLKQDNCFCFKLKDLIGSSISRIVVENVMIVKTYIFDVRMLDTTHAMIIEDLYGGIVDLTKYQDRIVIYKNLEYPIITTTDDHRLHRHTEFNQPYHQFKTMYCKPHITHSIYLSMTFQVIQPGRNHTEKILQETVDSKTSCSSMDHLGCQFIIWVFSLALVGGLAASIIVHNQAVIEVEANRNRYITSPDYDDDAVDKEYSHIDTESEQILESVKADMTKRNKDRDTYFSINVTFSVAEFKDSKLFCLNEDNIPWYVNSFWWAIVNILFIWFPWEVAYRSHLATIRITGTVNPLPIDDCFEPQTETVYLQVPGQTHAVPHTQPIGQIPQHYIAPIYHQPMGANNYSTYQPPPYIPNPNNNYSKLPSFIIIFVLKGKNISSSWDFFITLINEMNI